MPGAREKSKEANAAIGSESEARCGPGGKEGMQETRALRLHTLRVRKNGINHERHLCCYHSLFESHGDPMRWVGHGPAGRLITDQEMEAQRDEGTCPS